jgi:trigger factor
VKVTVEHPSESEAVLNVELDWKELEKASDRAYHKLADRYNVPGFRRGHAPRTMLERMIGKDAIYQEGLEDLISTSYADAIRQSDLTPLSQPALDTPEIAMGQPYTYTARVPVLPPIKLGDYKAIRVEQPSTEVTEEDVEHTIEHIRQDGAQWLPVERPAQVGDKMTVNLKLAVGDRTISDLHDNEFELAEERPGIFSGMDPHLIGMSEGESKEFTTTIPEDYANTDLAGKEAQYAVTVKAVKVRELPAVDDELAKSAGNYETLDALRQAIRAQLKSQKENDARRTVRENALTAISNETPAEIPHVLVHEEADTMMEEMERSLASNRLTLEQYLEMLGKTKEAYHEELEPEATERVKRELILDAIAEAEEIAVSDGEIDNWLELVALVGAGRRRRLRDLSARQKANVTARLRRDKAAARLIEIATQDHAAPSDAANSSDETEKAAKTAAAVGAAEPEAPAKTPKAAKTASVTTPAAAEALAPSDVADDAADDVAASAPTDADATPTE